MPLIVDQHRTQLADDGNLAEAVYTTATLATDASEYVLFTTPGGSNYRITGATYEAFGGVGEVSLYTNPIITANGDPVTTWFYNLQMDTTPNLNVYSGPTVSDEGDLRFRFKLFGSVSAAGESTSRVSVSAVRKLSAGESYLIRLKALSNNVDMQVFLEWAEL